MKNTKLFTAINDSVFGGRLDMGDFGARDITCDDEQFNEVILFGNDECWAGGEFFQFGICDGEVYRFYYDVPEELEDLGDIDYSIAYRYEEC